MKPKGFSRIKKIFPKRVIFLSALYSVLFSTISILKYRAYGYHDFDLAVYAQAMYNLLQGSLHSSILNIHLFGNHFVPIIFFLVPLYALFPSAMTFLVIQSVALGIGVFPIYLIARRLLDERFAILFSIVYATFPPVLFVNLFEFHPDALSIPLVLLAFYYFVEKKFKQFIVFSIASMFCIENVPMVIVMFGFLSLLFKRPVKWIVMPIVLGSLWLFLAFRVVITPLNKGVIDFSTLYHHLGPTLPMAIRTMLSDPMTMVARYVLTKANLDFVLQLFGPLLPFSLLGSIVLLPTLPIFLQHFLSNRATEHTIYYHYHALLVPFVLGSAVVGCRWMMKLLNSKKTKSAFLYTLTGLYVAYGLFVLAHIGEIVQKRVEILRDEMDEVREFFVRSIPREAPVVATYDFLSHLSNRKSLYSFSHAVTMGFHTLSKIPYELPKDTQYALVDFHDRLTFPWSGFPKREENLRKWIASGEWSVLSYAGNIVLFKKGPPGRTKLYHLEKNSPGSHGYTTQYGDVMLSVRMTGESLEFSKRLMNLEMRYQCLRATPERYLAVYTLVDGRHRVKHSETHSLCYRMYPSDIWNPGESIREHYKMIIPHKLRQGTYGLYVGFIEGDSGRRISFEGEGGHLIHEIFVGKISVG